MLDMEKLKKAESLMNEATKLMETARELMEESKTSSNKDTLIYEYTKNFGTDCNCWYLDSMGDIIGSSSTYSISDIPKNEFNYFNNFWNTKYAEKSRELIQFNNKLLAFKWCWDRDYEPDWSSSNEPKFFVYKSYVHRENVYNTYQWDRTWSLCENVVYFSSKEIVQKCCEWLNSGKEE